MFTSIRKYFAGKRAVTDESYDDKKSKSFLRHLFFEEKEPAGDNWRITILNAILYGTFALSLLSAAAGSYNQIRDGRYHYVIFYLGCVFILAAAAFLKSLKYRLRTSVLLIIFYLVAISELAVSGLTGDGDHFMTAIVVLSGILLNVRIGLGLFCITILSMVFIAYLITGGYIRLEPFLGEVSYRPRNWASAIIAYTFMTATMFISIVFMRRKMQKTIKENEKSIMELTRENRIRKKREQSLNIFKQLLTTSYDSIAYIDRENRIKTANDAFFNDFGFLKNKNKSIKEGKWSTDEISEKILQVNLKQAQKGENILFEYLLKKSTGEEKHLEILLTPFTGSTAGPDGIVFIARDMTEKMKMEQDLIETNEEGYRTFSMALHDGLSHFLLDVAIHCTMLVRRLKKKESHLVKEAERIEGQINKAISLTRNISSGLFPLTLKSMNMKELIEQKKKLLEESFKIRCTIHSDPHLFLTDKTVAMHLHYIMQEAVINIVKHARATAVEITLRHSRTHYDLVISDNGVGLAKDGKGPVSGTGRRIMEYRARKIGGSISFNAVKGRSTEVVCMFPLSMLETG